MTTSQNNTALSEPVPAACPSAALAPAASVAPAAPRSRSPRVWRCLAALLALAGLAGPALAAITASPAALSFSQQVNQTATPQTITVSNNSGAPVNFSGFQFNPSGFFSVISSSSTCLSGAPVPNGGSCVVVVRPAPQAAPGTFTVNFNLFTLQFGSLSVADAVLNLLVFPATTPTTATITTGPSTSASPSGGSALSSVSPRQVALTSGGPTSRQLSYDFLGTSSTPVASYVCSQLIANPPSGASPTNPCATGGQSFGLSVESSGFTTQQASAGRSRASETVLFPEAFARLSIALAQQSGNSSLYFVRQFQNGYYAVVQLQAVGSSLSDPLTLTEVQLAFRTGRGRQPTVSLAPGEAAPPSFADIYYTGSGTLRGRWEVVEPGLAVPDRSDLVPEASVPRSERGRQRRYRLVDRFEYALGPGGHFVLPGPDPARLPVRQTGGYLVLLRIEAVPAGTRFGAAAEHGAAPFSLPVLVYQVGVGIDGATALAARFVELLDVKPGLVPTLAWRPLPEAASWRVELADANGIIVGSKFLRREETRYGLAGMLAQRTRGKAVQWRVQAFDAGRRPIGRSDWKDIKPG
ncbi:MAG: hypothetical protein H7346_22075 [Burkholderiaceae bacterium]|nr:hypothetical protein [Burkholderiaceae bacterium]